MFRKRSNTIYVIEFLTQLVIHANTMLPKYETNLNCNIVKIEQTFCSLKFEYKCLSVRM